MAFVGAEGVDAGAVVANVWIPLALVNVDARVAPGCEGVAVFADALEGALEIVALAVVADPRPVPTLVDIRAIPPGDSEFVAVRTDALEASGGVDALGIASARILQPIALVVVCSSSMEFKKNCESF